MYFTMEEDKRIQNRARFRDMESETYMKFEPEEVSQINDITVLFMEGNKDSIYPSVFQAPLCMVSDDLKRLIEPYDPAVMYRRVVMNQVQEARQHSYWLLLSDEIDCLHESSEWYPNGWDKVMVLDRKKIGARRIFRAKGMQTPKVIVHLDVSESIMRRTFAGVVFQPLDVK